MTKTNAETSEENEPVWVADIKNTATTEPH